MKTIPLGGAAAAAPAAVANEGAVDDDDALATRVDVIAGAGLASPEAGLLHPAPLEPVTTTTAATRFRTLTSQL
jgi:hypothetical protein